jgi:GNAT superfamily N-acetyltransferase
MIAAECKFTGETSIMTAIRRITAADAERVTALWNDASLEAAGVPLSDDERQAIRAGLVQYADHPDAAAFVAQIGERIVGYVTGSTEGHPIWRGRTGEIEELYVEPNARRQGVGSALVDHAVAWLRGRGAGTIRIQVCNESDVAKAFWKAKSWENDLTVFSLYE